MKEPKKNNDFGALSVRNSTKKIAKKILNKEEEEQDKALTYDDIVIEAFTCLADKKPYLKAFLTGNNS